MLLNSRRQAAAFAALAFIFLLALFYHVRRRGLLDGPCCAFGN
jgi:4-amino-4-deoxy-L-arabinose transferase-like glycosyltransferase